MVNEQIVVLMQHSQFPNLVCDFLILLPVNVLCLCICANLIELNRTNNVFR